MTELFRNVQHDCHRQNVKFASESYKGFSSLRLNVRRIDNGQTASSKPLSRYVVEHVECVICGCLSILVIRDKSTTEIGGEDFCRLEVSASEAGLPAPGRPNQHYQRKFGDSDLHECCLRAAWS